MTMNERLTNSALATLATLQIVMLAALFTKTAPHPPLTTPLFGIAPFLGASLSVVVAAIILGPLQSTMGRCLALTAVVLALVSFGPQKYFDAQFHLIWPAVIFGQIAALLIILKVVSSGRAATSTAIAVSTP